MVALKTERRVYLWRIWPQSNPKNASVTVTLGEVLGLLKAGYDQGEAEIYLSEDGRALAADADPAEKNPKNRVYIADMKEDKDTITFLINRGDINAADPAFIDVKTKDVEIVSPGDDQTQGWSAHLVIAKNKKADPQTWRGCYERMPHASSSYAEQLINTILERRALLAGTYTYNAVVKRAGKT